MQAGRSAGGQPDRAASGDGRSDIDDGNVGGQGGTAHNSPAGGRQHGGNDARARGGATTRPGGWLIGARGWVCFFQAVGPPYRDDDTVTLEVLEGIGVVDGVCVSGRSESVMKEFGIRIEVLRGRYVILEVIVLKLTEGFNGFVI